MLLASATQILPLILGVDSGMICGQTKGGLGSPLHFLKLWGGCVQGRGVVQWDGSSVSKSNLCVADVHSVD